MTDFHLEDQHDGCVFGFDEAGRGPLAGPVVAACVYIPPDIRRKRFIKCITDSKKLQKADRERLFQDITSHCLFSIAQSTVEEIDEINILQASMTAMARAFDTLPERTGNMAALIDGNYRPVSFPCQAKPVIGGDAKSVSIAAASILAKVTRDPLMCELASQHTVYGWHTNFGYHTRRHIEAINAHGVSEHHRRSFAPVRTFLQFGTTDRQIAFAV